MFRSSRKRFKIAIAGQHTQYSFADFACVLQVEDFMQTRSQSICHLFSIAALLAVLLGGAVTYTPAHATGSSYLDRYSYAD